MTVGIATLLYSVDYLPGAFTLAFRVRELLAESREHRLVLLVTPEVLEGITEDVLRALYELYDDFIELGERESASKATLARNRTNLAALGRPELADTFHKLQLWKLTQFHKVLYLDCDAFPLHAGFIDAVDHVPDQTPRQLVAVPDCGWPDLFNSGVMVIVPSLAVYGELAAHVETALSIDGADQGLLNLFFNRTCHRDTLPNEWRTLPFLYNVTVPNAGYQATPALDYFRRRIAVVHFIGHEKPWISRGVSDGFRELWWHTYNHFLARHFAWPAFAAQDAGASPAASAAPAHELQSGTSAAEAQSWAPPAESQPRPPAEAQSWAPAHESESGASAAEPHSWAPAHESQLRTSAAEAQSQAPAAEPRSTAPSRKQHLWTPIQDSQPWAPSRPEPLPSAPCAWDGTKEPPSKDAPPEAHKLALVGTYSWNTASPTLVPEDALLASPGLGSPFRSCRSSDKLPLYNPSPDPPQRAIGTAPRPCAARTLTPAAPIRSRPAPAPTRLQPAPALSQTEPPAELPAAASPSAKPMPHAAPTADSTPPSATAPSAPLFPWERYKPKTTRVFPE
ncbi:AaceriACR254Cp [[Ashbya] aceris (nom. inval.)]|nr:AaceriACR254Cp [[Ashbya] aceris (nom. inval.)]